MTTETGSKTNPSLEDNYIVIGAQINDHTAFLAGMSPERFFTDADIFSELQLLVTEYYKLDTLSNFWDVYNVEAEALGQKVVYPPDGIPDADRTQPLIVQRSDLDRIRPPNPYTSGRMPWINKVNKKFLEMTGKLDRTYFTAPLFPPLPGVNVSKRSGNRIHLFARNASPK